MSPVGDFLRSATLLCVRLQLSNGDDIRSVTNLLQLGYLQTFPDTAEQLWKRRWKELRCSYYEDAWAVTFRIVVQFP